MYQLHLPELFRCDFSTQHFFIRSHEKKLKIESFYKWIRILRTKGKGPILYKTDQEPVLAVLILSRIHTNGHKSSALSVISSHGVFEVEPLIESAHLLFI